jgi:hypothetical protein
MAGQARDLDIFKTIVLLILILLLFLFIRYYYNPGVQAGLPAPTQQSSSLPAVPAAVAPTMAAVTAVPTPAPVPTVLPANSSIPITSKIPDCPQAAPARISGVGARVKVVNALIPMRTRPAVPSSAFIMPLHVGSLLEIISLPVCESYLDGANLWWQVRALNGKTGWAAEASAIRPVLYYLAEIN